MKNYKYKKEMYEIENETLFNENQFYSNMEFIDYICHDAVEAYNEQNTFDRDYTEDY